MKKQQLILTSCAACSGAATISHNIPCPLQVQVMTWTTTQSFQLGGHRAHQKIWLIFGHSVKQPGDLGTGAKCQPWHGQRCCQFWCFCDFSLPYYGQAGVTLMTRPNDLWRHSACQWRGSSYSIPVPSLKFIGLPFGTYGAFSISALISLDL